MDSGAAEALFDFLDFQKEMTGCDLPHRHHLLLEYVNTGPGGVPGNQLILHTTWGGRINRPFAMALDAAWEENYGQRLEIYTGNDCIVVQLPHDTEADEVLSLVTSVNVEKLLRKRLEGSGFFGARFRECAGRSLLLTRNKIGQRMPLWMNRMRSQKLLASVMQYEDFPILLEAWRTCLQDEFDMESMKQVLTELETGVIRWSVTHTSYPSPMAQSSSWRQINDYLYRTDELKTDSSTSRLRSDLLNHVVFTPGIRPPVDHELVKQFELKQQRLSPDYSPETPREVVDWVKERLLIPVTEWERLLQAMKTDHKTDIKKLHESITDRLALINPPVASEPLVVAIETLPRITRALYREQDITIQSLEGSQDIPINRNNTVLDDAEDSDEIIGDVLTEWLRYYGPVTYDFIQTTLGLEKGRLSLVLEDIIDSQKVIMGPLIKERIDEYICDSENYEILLRLARASAVPVFEPLDIEWLPLFLAQHQGLTDTGDDLVFFIEELFRRIEQLLCLPLPAALWESEVLPARLRQYSTSWLDSAVSESNLRWVGSEKQRITFCFEPDLDLLQEDTASEADIEEPVDDNELGKVFPDTLGKYDFSTLLTQSGYRPGVLSDRLWESVWQGKVTNDSITTLRRGIMNRFKPPEISTPATGRRFHGRRNTGGRRSFTRWKNTLPYAGSWFLLPEPETDEDLLETEERMKDRVRLLLDRYGILFRELLEKESPAFQWRNAFRALRLMELSGEVLAGYFFHGIPGLQFISHQAFRRLQRKLPEDAVYWVNAADPASLCGIKLDSVRGSLPKRVPGTHLVYRGTRLVAISKRNGRDLTFNVGPDDPYLHEYLGHLRHLLTRQFQPLQGITIDTINDEKATRSPYRDVLRTAFDVQQDYKNVTLYRKSR